MAGLSISIGEVAPHCTSPTLYAVWLRWSAPRLGALHVPDACRTEAHDGECNKNARPSQPHSKLELIAAIAASMNERTFQLPGALQCSGEFATTMAVAEHCSACFSREGPSCMLLRSTGCARRTHQAIWPNFCSAACWLRAAAASSDWVCCRMQDLRAIKRQ